MVAQHRSPHTTTHHSLMLSLANHHFYSISLRAQNPRENGQADFNLARKRNENVRRLNYNYYLFANFAICSGTARCIGHSGDSNINVQYNFN